MEAWCEELVGTFVGEVGAGQVEYFVEFCDNRRGPSTMTRRLWMDCAFRVVPGEDEERRALLAANAHPLAHLYALMSLTVTDVRHGSANELTVSFDEDVVLVVTPEPAHLDPGSYAEWRLGPWLS